MLSRMIQASIAVIALLIVPLAAQAADIPSKAPAYSAPSYFSWTGFYIGLNGGYGFGTADWPTPPPTSFKATGYLAGVTLGYNYQTGSWVWGLEGDVDYSSLKGTETTVCGASPGCETKLKYFGTARGRIGYAWDRWLPYLTAGAAFGNIENSGPGGSETKTKLGWTAGLGVEYAFMGAWSAKLEYLYADLGTMTCSTCFAVSQDIKFKANIVRAGVNYRF
jgi:outer membrane immunogenic protein